MINAFWVTVEDYVNLVIYIISEIKEVIVFHKILNVKHVKSNSKILI